MTRLPRKLKKQLKKKNWEEAQKLLISIMLKNMTEWRNRNYPMTEWQYLQKVDIKGSNCQIVMPNLTK